MAFVNPEILQKIFGGAQQLGQTLGSAPQSQQQQLHQALMGAGAGMSQAAAQPGASFGQALGGGASGMMQGQQQAQQMQLNQMKMQQAQAEMERQERISKIMGDILQPRTPDFASQVATGPVQQPQIGPAQASPYTGGPGAMTARYESGGGGVGTVSTGAGDPGGVSYGTNQLSSNAGTMASFLQSPEGQPFAQHFSGQEPGSEQFNQSYQEVVQGAGPQFEQAQQQFLQRTHVAPVMQAAQQAGMPVDNPAIQAALHSQATQHSGEGNVQIINETMARIGPNSSPEDILDTLYDTRQRYAEGALRRSGASEDVIQGVRNRYQGERQDTLAMLGERQVGGQPQTQQTTQPQQTPLNGYQQRALEQQANDPLAGLPAGTRRMLSLLPPEDAAAAVVELQTRAPAEQPAAVREFLFRAGGDPELARQMMNEEAAAEDGLTTANKTKEQTIEALIANDPSADPQAIRDAVYGRRKVSHDPMSGRAEVVDVVTGETIRGASVEETERAEAAAADAELMSSIVPEGMDVAPAMGGTGFLANIINTAGGMIGLDATFSNAEVAKQAIDNLKTQTMTALAQEVAGRPSNFLLEQFERIAPASGNLLQGDARSRAKLRTTSALIDEKLRMVNAVVENPDKHKPATLDEARLNKLQLEALKRQYDTAYENFGTGSTFGVGDSPNASAGAAPGVGEFVREQKEPSASAPSGWEDDLWRELTEEERQQVIQERQANGQ